jgi:hypothetical protein
MKLGVLSSTNGSSNITIGQHRVLTRFNQENTLHLFQKQPGSEHQKFRKFTIKVMAVIKNGCEWVVAPQLVNMCELVSMEEQPQVS